MKKMRRGVFVLVGNSVRNRLEYLLYFFERWFGYILIILLDFKYLELRYLSFLGEEDKYGEGV